MLSEKNHSKQGALCLGLIKYQCIQVLKIMLSFKMLWIVKYFSKYFHVLSNHPPNQNAHIKI